MRKIEITSSGSSTLSGASLPITLTGSAYELYTTTSDYSLYPLAESIVKEGTYVCKDPKFNPVLSSSDYYVLQKSSGVCSSSN